MTIKEAIERIKSYRSDWEHGCKSHHPMKEALQMAIAALEKQEPYEKEGVWIRQVDGLHCSECDYKPQTTMLPDYCPNCYTKMGR